MFGIPLPWALCGAAVAVVLRPSAPTATTAAFAAAAAGFVVVACFDSLLDSPRVILLIALVGAIGLHAGLQSDSPLSNERGSRRNDRTQRHERDWNNQEP